MELGACPSGAAASFVALLPKWLPVQESLQPLKEGEKDETFSRRVARLWLLHTYILTKRELMFVEYVSSNGICLQFTHTNPRNAHQFLTAMERGQVRWIVRGRKTPYQGRESTFQSVWLGWNRMDEQGERGDTGERGEVTERVLGDGDRDFKSPIINSTLKTWKWFPLLPSLPPLLLPPPSLPPSPSPPTSLPPLLFPPPSLPPSLPLLPPSPPIITYKI